MKEERESRRGKEWEVLSCEPQEGAVSPWVWKLAPEIMKGNTPSLPEDSGEGTAH